MQVIVKKRKVNLFGVILFMILMLSCINSTQSKQRALIITGGHNFDQTEFFNLFESLSDFQFDTISQPLANQLICSGKAIKYNILVFYDSWQLISEAEKDAYMKLTDYGTGFLFLHHSLASYQDWDKFWKIRGGGYYRSNPPDSIKDMRYKHDLDLLVEILDPNHPITLGMKDFEIHDEGYSNIFINDEITPLLKTRNPDCAEVIAWTNNFNNSKIVYLMGGHDRVAFENENYRELIRNSLSYLNSKKK